jgi:leucyl/phenylalanyl-tRNA--protein transferase
MIPQLSSQLEFPHPSQAIADGLLAFGGDLSAERLLLAYHSGIFPWYSEEDPILWWSPDPRMVLFLEELKVSKSMKQLIKKEAFQVTVNQDFEAVIEACSMVKREGQQGTWITSAMKKAYTELHEKGHAYSVEVWQNQKMVGGLYGVWLKDKKVFCGESMFSKVSNASKYGFIYWVKKLQSEGVQLIDCQVYTQHLERLGAREISREAFLSFLN